MKLLFLSSRPPWPTTRADQLTVNKLIRFLVGRGHEVDLISFIESDSEEIELREGLGQVCRRIDVVRLSRARSFSSTLVSLPTRMPMQVAYYLNGAMHELVAKRLSETSYDLVYAHLIRMAEFARNLDVPRVLGMQISQSLNLARLASSSTDLGRRLFYRIEAAKVTPYEAEVCTDFDRVILCGQSDIDALNKTAPVANAEICPHGQDVPEIDWVRSAGRTPNVTVISGVMGTYTNVIATEWYSKEVLPRIREKIPDVSFWIVGRKPQKSILDLHDPPNIVVTGEVEDVNDHLRKASVAVVPVHAGAGMQNKIVQAMACELPVVATTVANEGIKADPDSEIIIADTAEAFADAVVSLLTNAEERNRLAQAGRQYVEQNWTWDRHFLRLEEILTECLRNVPTSAT